MTAPKSYLLGLTCFIIAIMLLTPHLSTGEAEAVAIPVMLIGWIVLMFGRD